MISSASKLIPILVLTLALNFAAPVPFASATEEFCAGAERPECTQPRTIPGRYRENCSRFNIGRECIRVQSSWCDYEESLNPADLCPNGGELIVFSSGRVGNTKRCEYTYMCCFCTQTW